MRKLFVLLIMAAASMAATAQVTYNFKGGAGLAWVSNLGDESGTKFVWKAGLGAEVPMNNKWLLMPSVEYAQKGVKAGDFDVSFNYIQVPAMFAYRVNLNTVNMTLKIGPYVAYALSGSQKIDGIELGDPFEEDLNRFDVGGDLGVDFEYHRFVLGVEFEHGITTLTKTADKVYNNSIYATVGYKF